MGFDAEFVITLYFKHGNPYFIRNYEEVYDLSQIPKLPEEFYKYESLRGYSWKALLESSYHDNEYSPSTTEIPIGIIDPDYNNMCSNPNYADGDFTEEDVQHFAAFCDWVRKTGVEYTYKLSW